MNILQCLTDMEDDINSIKITWDLFCRDELHNFLATHLSKIDTSNSDEVCQAIEQACLECDHQGYDLDKDHGAHMYSHFN